MIRSLSKLFLATALPLALPVAALAGPGFTALGFLPGGTASQATAISSDGSTVVGYGGSTPGTQGFRYTVRDRAMIGLGDLPGGTFESIARGVSADGSVIVGSSSSANNVLSFAREAFRYQNGVMTGLGDIPGGPFLSHAGAVSGDGKVVTGTTAYAQGGSTFVVDFKSCAFRYENGIMSGLPGVRTGSLIGNAVSEDGKVIVGQTNRFGPNGDVQQLAFRHSVAGGSVSLGDFPRNAVFPRTVASATGVSRDGAVIVGWGDFPTSVFQPKRREAFRWTEASGIVSIGDLPGGAVLSESHAVSPDGRAIVGQGTTADGKRAFLWNESNGMVDLTVLLTARNVLPQGWTLLDATGLTVGLDGRPIVVGTGTDPQGRTQGFVATVPPPTTFTSLGSLETAGFFSSARGLSADGKTVVGVSDSVTGDRAFVWTAARGLFDIGTGAATATGVSADGKVVVGASAGAGAFRWLEDGTGTYLGANARAGGIASGGVVVGSSLAPNGERQVFRWSATSTARFPTYVGGSTVPAHAVAASADGSVFVGATLTAVPRAFVWNATGGQVPLPALPGGTGASEALGVSGDGKAVVGWSRGARGPEAFRWTSAGIVGLGNLKNPNGTFGNASRANAVSPDGTIVVGAGVSGGKNRAFVWDGANGMQNLQDLLVAVGGAQVDLEGWTLFDATGVVALPDGTIVVSGTGYDPQGRTQAFHATLPTLTPPPGSTPIRP